MYDLFHLVGEQVDDHLHQVYSASLLDLLILHHDMMHNNLDKALFEVEAEEPSINIDGKI